MRVDDTGGPRQPTVAEITQACAKLPREACWSCKFFYPTDTTWIDANDDPQCVRIFGMCRRFPPHTMFIEEVGSWCTEFPEMQAREWCGEYRTGTDDPARRTAAHFVNFGYAEGGE